MKRALRLMTGIIIIMTALLFTVNASANDELQYGDFIYQINGSEVTIAKYTGNDSFVYIPDMIDNRDVTTIGEEAFDGNMDLVITIPLQKLSIKM